MNILHPKSLVERFCKEAGITALMETQLEETVPDAKVHLDNFLIFRADQTRDSGKECGGGVCMYISNRSCNNIKVSGQICTPNLEMFTLCGPSTCQGNSLLWPSAVFMSHPVLTSWQQPN